MKKYRMDNQLVLARKFIEEDIQRGIHYYENVFNSSPDYMTEEDFIDFALAYEDIGEVEKGIKVYEGLLENFPQSDRGYYGLGVFYEALEKPQKAISFYLKAIELNPEFFEAYFYLAGAYDDIEEYELALNGYKDALRLDDQHYYANLNIGSIYESLNEDDKAFIYFEKALSIEYHYMALFNLGVLSMKKKQFEKAKEYYEEVLSLNAEYGYAYLNLSLIYKEKKDYIKVIEILSLGIERTENESYLFYHRGCAHALLNNKDASISDLQIALNLYPDFDSYIQEDEDLVNIKDEMTTRLKTQPQKANI